MNWNSLEHVPLKRFRNQMSQPFKRTLVNFGVSCVQLNFYSIFTKIKIDLRTVKVRKLFRSSLLNTSKSSEVPAETLHQEAQEENKEDHSVATKLLKDLEKARKLAEDEKKFVLPLVFI